VLPTGKAAFSAVHQCISGVNWVSKFPTVLVTLGVIGVIVELWVRVILQLIKDHSNKSKEFITT